MINTLIFILLDSTKKFKILLLDYMDELKSKGQHVSLLLDK